jgi:hypothetical protein
VRKTTKDVSEHGWSLGRDLSPGRPEFEVGVLTIPMRRSLKFRCDLNFVWSKCLLHRNNPKLFHHRAIVLEPVNVHLIRNPFSSFQRTRHLHYTCI